MTRRGGPGVLLALAVMVLPGCYTVGFHPVENPAVLDKSPETVSLHVPEEIRGDVYRFRAWGSGIANRWTVPYGTRVDAFAHTYLGAAFAGVRDANGPDDIGEDDLLVRLTSASYRIQGQAAHLDLGVQAVDRSGSSLLDKTYSEGGEGRWGLVFVGGVFAQKEAVRSSTNGLFREVFLQLVHDLRAALAEDGASREATAASADGS